MGCTCCTGNVNNVNFMGSVFLYFVVLHLYPELVLVMLMLYNFLMYFALFLFSHSVNWMKCRQLLLVCIQTTFPFVPQNPLEALCVQDP